MYTVFGNVQIKLEYSSGRHHFGSNFVNKSVRRIKYQVCLIRNRTSMPDWNAHVSDIAQKSSRPDIENGHASPVSSVAVSFASRSP